MAKLSDLLQGQKSTNLSALLELKIAPKSEEIVRPFTDEVVEAQLHYDKDESIQGYFHCLGEETCPCCKAGVKIYYVLLIPLFSVTHQSIVVLKMPKSYGPFDLAPQIAFHLGDPDIAGKILLVKRLNNFQYTVSARSAGQHSNLGANQISTFIEAHKKGSIDLGSIFPRLTDQDMRAVPSIGLKLDLLETPAQG